AIRLKSIGITPLQSSSIDLFLATENAQSIFELKTTTQENILGQAAKGAFQLGCYKAALGSAEHIKSHLVLVMEATGIAELDSYASEILSTFGIRSLFYNVGKPWPDRLKGLEEFLVD